MLQLVCLLRLYYSEDSLIKTKTPHELKYLLCKLFPFNVLLSCRRKTQVIVEEVVRSDRRLLFFGDLFKFTCTHLLLFGRYGFLSLLLVLFLFLSRSSLGTKFIVRSTFVLFFRRNVKQVFIRDQSVALHPSVATAGSGLYRLFCFLHTHCEGSLELKVFLVVVPKREHISFNFFGSLRSGRK